MAITKHNEVNELMALAFGQNWIGFGLATADASQLATVASYGRSVAENCLRARDVLDTYRLGIDVDSDEWDHALNLMSKLLGDTGTIALCLEETSNGYLRDPEFQIDFRRGAERAERSTRAKTNGE